MDIQQTYWEISMSDQKTTETVRTVINAGAEAAQQGAERLQGQTNDMQEMIRRASQDAAQRTSENLELMKRLAETMASSVRETSSEMVEWAKQASKQQQEATRQIIQARSLDEVLDTSSIPSFHTIAKVSETTRD
jgi:hypothetical protein